MKIVSWNVNGLNSVMQKGVVETLVRKHYPDIIFMQEIKCTESKALELMGRYSPSLTNNYMLFTDGSTIPGRHGVAMFVRVAIADELNINFLPTEVIDSVIDGQLESRLQAFVIGKTLLLNTYSVNVRPDLCRLEQRQAHDNKISAVLADWKSQGNDRAIVVGDFNVVREPKDYWGPRLIQTYPGMTDSERNSFENILATNGLKDTYRELHPQERKYSYWSYRGYARDSNKGWRIDYALVTEAMLGEVETADILTEINGSDHAPVLLELKEEL